MPPRILQFQVETQRRLVIVTMAGAVTGADIAQTMRAIYTHADWQPGFNIFWEGSLISQLLFERDDLPALLELQRSFVEQARGGRDVIVTDRVIDEMMGDMNMYVSLVQHIRTTFLARSVEEAMALLTHRDSGRRLPRDGEPIR